MEKEEELFIPKTKHKGLKICLAILLIVGLCVGGYFLYQYKFNNPKTIITNSLEEAKGNIKNAFKETSTSSKYKLDGHIKIDSNIDEEIIQLLKDIELQLTGEMDTDESISNYQINAKYKNDKLIAANFYQEKDNVYLFLEGLYDKYLKVNSEMQDLTITNMPKIDINPDDVQVIIDAIINALENEIDTLKINQKSDTITIDGKEVNVINNYVEFKDKELNNFIKSIIINLKSNQKFSEVLKKIITQDVNSLLDNLAQEIDEQEFKGTYKINFYTDKGILKKNLVSIRQTVIVNNVTSSINVDKISDDEVLFSINSMGIVYSIKVKQNKSVIKALASMNIMGQYINFDIDLNYEKINEINKVDVSNSKDINDLTEQEIEEIEKKLMDNNALIKLIEEINKMNKTEA